MEQHDLSTGNTMYCVCKYVIVILVMLHCISSFPFVSQVWSSTVWVWAGSAVHQSAFLALNKKRRRESRLRQEPQSNVVPKCALVSGNQQNSSIQSPTQANRQPHLYLLSLQWAEANASKVKFSKAVADIWRWKDSVLGDGRDFFVPKPNTLRALQSYLLHPEENCCFEISECVVLSNCARLEILLVVNDDKTQSDQQLTEIVVSEISSSLVHQVQSHLKMKNDFITSAFAALDWPGLIHPTARPTGADVLLLKEEIQEVRNHWTVWSGPKEIVHHLCLVAAGLAARPRRPHRDVVFQPFSSRDAHILLQLKRTVDIVSSDTSAKNLTRSSSYLLILLKFALQAGKAARNPQQLPALMELRNQYGETGNSRKYDMTPPPETIQKVVQVCRNYSSSFPTFRVCNQ
jgi:hypothetical protein